MRAIVYILDLRIVEHREVFFSWIQIIILLYIVNRYFIDIKRSVRTILYAEDGSQSAEWLSFVQNGSH